MKRKLIILASLLLSFAAQAETVTYAWGWAPDGQRLFRSHEVGSDEASELWTLLPNMGQDRWHGQVDDTGNGWIYTIEFKSTGSFIYTWDIVYYSLVRPRSWARPHSSPGQFTFEEADFEEDIENGRDMPVPPNYQRHLPLK
jgi:hypothetical protein